MREKVIVVDPGVTLIRIMDTLVEDLIETSDVEILQATKNLGMNPHMKVQRPLRASRIR